MALTVPCAKPLLIRGLKRKNLPLRGANSFLQSNTLFQKELGGMQKSKQDVRKCLIKNGRISAQSAPLKVLFCVVVLWPSQHNGVMLSMVILPILNAINQYLAHSFARN